MAAFTLIELLVVIAVIAILAALLITGIRSAMATARTTQCAGIMRQWVQAFPLYAADNNGALPTGYIMNRDFATWQRRMAPYLVGASSTDSAGEFKLRSGLHCPGDFTAASAAHTWAYATNHLLIPDGHVVTVNRFTDIPHPEITLLLVEANNADMQNLNPPPTSPCILYQRHGNGLANFAFADMHIEALNASDATTRLAAHSVLLDLPATPGP